MQRHPRLPAGEREQSGGEIFLKRCGAFGVFTRPPATLEERFAGKIQVKASLVDAQKHEHANIRVSRIDGGTNAACLPKTIADRVLDAKRGEIEAAQWRALGGDIDPQGRSLVEPVLPLGLSGQFVKPVFIAITSDGHAQEHSGGDPASQIDRHRKSRIAIEYHACAGYLRCDSANPFKLSREDGLEPARARGKQRKGGVRLAFVLLGTGSGFGLLYRRAG